MSEDYTMCVAGHGPIVRRREYHDEFGRLVVVQGHLARTKEIAGRTEYLCGWCYLVAEGYDLDPFDRAALGEAVKAALLEDPKGERSFNEFAERARSIYEKTRDERG